MIPSPFWWPILPIKTLRHSLSLNGHAVMKELCPVPAPPSHPLLLYIQLFLNGLKQKHNYVLG